MLIIHFLIPVLLIFGAGSAPDNAEDGPHSGDATTGPGNGQFRVPSLRNIANTAPYMHNGSIKTLKQVIEFYDGQLDFASLGLGSSAEVSDNIAEGGQYVNGIGFTPQDVTDLENFLKTLSDR